MVRTNAPQFRGVLNWVVTTFIEHTLQASDLNVLDISLDAPNLIGKYQRRPDASKNGFLLYIQDHDGEVKKKWIERKQPFQAEFLTQWSDLKVKSSLYCVFSFGELNFGGPTRDAVKEKLQFIYDSLKDGGIYLGWYVDTGALWNTYSSSKRYQDLTKVSNIIVQQEELDENTGKMKVTDSDESILEYPPFFGLKIKLSIHGEDSMFWDGYSVHTPSLIDLCEEIGFDIVTIENLEDYYQGNFQAFYHHLIAYQVIKDKNQPISPSDLELIKILSVFVLQKNEKGRDLLETHFTST